MSRFVLTDFLPILTTSFQLFANFESNREVRLPQDPDKNWVWTVFHWNVTSKPTTPCVTLCLTDVFGPIEHTYTFTEVGYCDVTAQFRSIQRIEQICKQSFGPKRVQKRGPKKGTKNTVTFYKIAIADSTILLSCFSDYISAYWSRPIISWNYFAVLFLVTFQLTGFVQ